MNNRISKKLRVLTLMAVLFIIEIACNPCGKYDNRGLSLNSVRITRIDSELNLDTLKWSDEEVYFDLKKDFRTIASNKSISLLQNAYACSPADPVLRREEFADLILIEPELGFDSVKNSTMSYFSYVNYLDTLRSSVNYWKDMDSSFFSKSIIEDYYSSITYFKLKKRPKTLPAQFHFVRRRNGNDIWRSQSITIIE